jgi:hypothetical protein
MFTGWILDTSLIVRFASWSWSSYCYFSDALYIFGFRASAPGVGSLGEHEPTSNDDGRFHPHPQLNLESTPYELFTMRPSQIMRSGGDSPIGKYGK